MSKKEYAVEVNNVSKIYKISHQLAKNDHPTIKEDIIRMIRKPLEVIGAKGGLQKEDLWALNNVSFKVPKGEVVGLMGRNGSGKSTLFKIMSKITQPSKGEVIINGTSASLLEVGTGFHPELSGRENIYFNGSILGMSKAEIDQKFDDIVAFSEVEKFLDTPIKFYSSGMRVRLAFSVAANLDPDILIIDEVLAVGDVQFKQKSIKRMQEIANSGKTVLFVSHIVGQIERICTSGVVLDHGKKVFEGEIGPSIEKYLELNALDESQANSLDGGGGGLTRADVSSGIVEADVEAVEVVDTKAVPSLNIDLSIENFVGEDFKDLWLGVTIQGRSGDLSTMTNEMASTPITISSKDKVTKLRLHIPYLNLVPGGPYHLRVGLKDMMNRDVTYSRRSDVGRFTVPHYEVSGIKVEKDRANKIPQMLLDYSIKKR